MSVAIFITIAIIGYGFGYVMGHRQGWLVGMKDRKALHAAKQATEGEI